MALIHFDGCGEHYTSGSHITKWEAFTGIGITTGRFGTGNALDLLDTDTCGKNFGGAGVATMVFGGAFRFDAQSTTARLVRFIDPTVEHCYLSHDGSSHLRFTRFGGSVLGTGTKTIVTGVWYYIEIKVTIDDTVGAVEVRVDGVTDINVSGVDTRNAGTAAITRVYFGQGGGASGIDMLMDDLYFLDTTGGAPTNDFLGDCRVEALFPNGNGNSSQFDGSDGNSTDNYLLVDETNSDADTTYVESPDVSDKDTYTYGNLTVGAGTVYGAQIIPIARKTDAGTRTIKTVARLSGTETDGPSQILSPSYLTLSDVRETKPGGGVWTISDINNAEFGVKVFS